MASFIKVRGSQYLYRRGNSLYFRRGVPEYARHQFGGRREVQVSFGPCTLSDARYRLAREIAAFDRSVGVASRAKAVASGLPAQLRIPSNIEMDEAVRAWLVSRLDRANMHIPSGDMADHVLADLDRQSEDVKRGLRSGGREISTSTSWIADTVVEESGWDIDPGSAEYKYLVRMIGRGQREAANRLRQEIEGDPINVQDENFSPEQYRLDLERARDRPSKVAVPMFDMLDGYVSEKEPKPSTVRAWRRQIAKLAEFLGHDDARRITPGDILRWKQHLLASTSRSGERLTARTVKDTYLAAIKTVLGWAAENHYIPENPARGITVRTPKRVRRRDPGFSPEEAELILKSTVVPPAKQLSPERAFARRWVPWLCAYTGARVNEITQLRREDVFQEGEVWLILITPEAGTVKNNAHRKVAIHPAILEQGFVQAISDKKGPLFFDPARRLGQSDENTQPKKVGEYLAQWVRKIGIVDEDLQPNHAWRHRFKTLARRYGMDAEVRDAIQGHVPRTEGEGYGEIPADVLDRAIRLLPMPDFHM